VKSNRYTPGVKKLTGLTCALLGTAKFGSPACRVKCNVLYMMVKCTHSEKYDSVQRQNLQCSECILCIHITQLTALLDCVLTQKVAHAEEQLTHTYMMKYHTAMLSRLCTH
jgi:hypothetical protein